MANFDEREKGYERKFQHDQELAFKIKVRRNRLLGLWAAEQLGLNEDQAEAYARAVIDSEMQKGGDDGVVAKIRDDFAAKGVAFDTARIRIELDRFTGEARSQLGAN
jgi:hypothetical protein